MVCPEKEVEFQRAPDGEPCLPTHLPIPCCLCPPASHANPFCHVRVLHSSSLHVCAVWAGVAVLPGRGHCPRSPSGLKSGHWNVWYGTPAVEPGLSSSPGQEVKPAGTRGQVTRTGRDPHSRLLRRRGSAPRAQTATLYRLAASGHLCGGQKSWLAACGSGPCFPGLFPRASAR